MTAAPLLSIRALQVVLRLDDGVIPILDGIDLDLAPGKVMALVGESGSGKSVTAQAILRILPRTLQIAGGTMLLRSNGAALDLAGVPADGKVMQGIRGRRIGMIFQEPMSSFSPLHTVGNQVGEVLRIHERLSKQAARQRTIELLDRVGIPNPARAVDRYPFEFSGGMRQRAMIAKALSCNPALLLADEPTTALDVTIQAQILTLMRDLQAEFGMGILFITHDLGVVAQMADEVAIMYAGRIVERGPVRAIFRDPQHPYTMNLLRAVPRLVDLHRRRSLEPIRGSVPSLYDMPEGCSFHPRCEFFMAGRCDAAPPKLAAVGANHLAACYRHG
jgi:oligopeptide/dipeptide ABC transporter ATP-binding protein